jgi:transposase
LLRRGRRPALGIKAWTAPYMAWVRQLQFGQAAQQATLQDYLHEVDHHGERVRRLEQAITEAVKLASPQVQEVVKGLQALRGIAEISAVTIVSELGQVSRFASARQLMAYSGAVPSEDSSGKRKRRGSITKTGNAHLRRIVVEAAWSYRHRPATGPRLRKRQEEVPEPIREIAWKAAPITQAIREAIGGRKRAEKDHHRSGARTVGLHLGHRGQDRNVRQAADDGLTRSKSKSKKLSKE